MPCALYTAHLGKCIRLAVYFMHMKNSHYTQCAYCKIAMRSTGIFHSNHAEIFFVLACTLFSDPASQYTSSYLMIWSWTGHSHDNMIRVSSSASASKPVGWAGTAVRENQIISACKKTLYLKHVSYCKTQLTSLLRFNLQYV